MRDQMEYFLLKTNHVVFLNSKLSIVRFTGDILKRLINKVYTNLKKSVKSPK